MDFIEEFKKCHNDFIYFVEKYVKIQHPKKGIIPFEVYEYYKQLAKDYADNRFLIIKKFRQGGFSTFSVIWGLWKCLFHLDERWIFIAKTDREAINLGKIVNFVISQLPDQFKPLMATNNDHEKAFPCTAGHMCFFPVQAARSRGCTGLVIDEAAFIPNMDSYWQAMYPVLSTGGRCIVNSTTNGIGNWFHETWVNAVEKKNNFHPVDIPYTAHPVYRDEAWVKETRKCLGEKNWLQEMEGHFVAPERKSVKTKQEKKQALIKLVCEIFDDEDEV